MLIYNTLINTFSAFVSVLGAVVRPKRPRKFFRFVAGRRHLISNVRATFKPDSRPVVWVHSASYGEYSVARPIIKALRKNGCQVVATFFSPSGYEAVIGNNDVDYCYYMPLDTVANARAFLDIIKPVKVMFSVSEYWYNFLTELKKRDIPTFLVSAKINADSVFFKWYGLVHRRCLDSYRHIFVIDDESKEHLAQLGHHNVSKPGDPLFDNAIEKAAEDWSDPIVERFANGDKLFIAGSIHDENDLQMISDLANRHRDTRFVIAPHEPSAESTIMIQNALHGKALAYSKCTTDTDFTDTQALIIDNVGKLAYLYRYGSWAYVGGGFTRYLHSIIEATVYGMPVSFGPMTHRKITPTQVAALGIGAIVTDSDSLDKWFATYKNNSHALAEVKQKANNYVNANAQATNKIVDKILS